GGATIQAVAGAATLIQLPAALTASATLLSPVVSVGQAVLYVLTVTNPGEAALTGVVPPTVTVTGGAVVTLAAPPGAPVTLAGGSMVTWTWTVTALAAGTASFSATIGGTDANSGLPVSLLSALPAGLLVQTAATLVAAPPTAWPTPVCAGQVVTVVLAVTNTGQAT